MLFEIQERDGNEGVRREGKEQKEKEERRREVKDAVGG